jgi:hypothetical protein
LAAWTSRITEIVATTATKIAITIMLSLNFSFMDAPYFLALIQMIDEFMREVNNFKKIR